MTEMYLGAPKPGEAPGFADLETLAREHTDYLADKLDAEQDRYGVVGDEFVPNTACQQYLNTMAPRYAHAFTLPHTEPLLESFVRRPMRLGMVMAQELVQHSYLRPNVHQFEPRAATPSYNATEYWMECAGEFLATHKRVMLTGLLANYSKSFTENLMDHTRAVAIGGLTLLHIEESRYATFCENQIIQFRGELKKFAGDLSELE